ncbi:MAG: Ig-like domain-containing protein [Halobacteriota archaeon]
MKKEVICISLISFILFSPFGALVHATPLNAAISTRWTIEDLYGGRCSAATVSVGQNYNGSVSTTWNCLIIQVADAIAWLKTSTPTKALTPTRLTINATPSIVTVRQAFTISGRLTNATGGALIAGKIIQLQKNVNGTWTDVIGEENTTSARGSYSISVSEGTAGIYEYRANYTGNATYAGSHSASVFVTVRQPTQLTAAANPAIVALGQTFTIYGSLTAADGTLISGETIQLQKNVSGTWTDVSGKKNTTSIGGSYSISVSEGTAGIYEYRANYVGRATYAGSHSASVFVTVKPPTRLTAAANPATVATGQTFTIYGSLTAVKGAPMSGETIQLQKNVNGTWTDASGEIDTTSTGGSYSISVSEGTAGIYEYRANYSGNITYAGNYSSSVFVTVKQPIQLMPTQLTATANPPKVDSGWYFNINGVLTNATSGAPITGQIIQLQKKLGGEWTDISGRKTLTGADGSYSITYSEGAYGSYEFRTLYAGNDTYAASNSTNVTVTVQSIPTIKTKTQLSLIASPTTVNNKTEQITFTGILTPESVLVPGQTIPDQTIMLQKNVSGVWINMAHNTTDASGSVSFVRTEVFKGTYHYRLYYAGSEVFEANKSNDVTIVSTVGPSALASLGALVAITITWGYIRHRRLK